jgi:phosphonate transport system ATP-binding protein
VFDGYRDEFDMDVIDEIYGDIDTEGMFAPDADRNVDDASSQAISDGGPDR